MYEYRNDEDKATNKSQIMEDSMEKNDDGESQATCNYYRFIEHLSKKDSRWSKSEFHKYIIESCEKFKFKKVSIYPNMDKDFDILAWWNRNSGTSMFLSKMAKDIFSIPISTTTSFYSS